MITRQYNGGYYNPISMETRYARVMEILKKAEGPMSSSDICKEYISNHNTSDICSTSTILNILTLANIVKRTQTQYGRKQFRMKYELIKR